MVIQNYVSDDTLNRVCVELRIFCGVFSKQDLPRKFCTFFRTIKLGRSTKPKVNLKEIADRIYGLESSYGKQDRCKKIGLWNGYGFKQGVERETCYSSHELVEQLVINWLDDKLKTMNLGQSLCYYNQGIVTDKCDYYKHYLTLK